MYILLTYTDRLKAVQFRFTLCRWGIGADLYKTGLTLWLFTSHYDHAFDIGN